jgi:hypothetical protein
VIALDDNGNFVTDDAGHLTTTRIPGIQNAKCELRCIQGSWPANLFFGRNQLIWTISQSVQDRSLDINRVATKYVQVISVTYEEDRARYNVQVA